ncbi:MAG: hypothetical protein QME52_13505 [Bacteroidota bacterium]|nr:hypothetical protein [Bacteroidota bacterium]
MTIETLNKRVKKIEKELRLLKQSKMVFTKVRVDEALLLQVKKACFDFDVERFVTQNDLKRWKLSLTRTHSSGT